MRITPTSSCDQVNDGANAISGLALRDEERGHALLPYLRDHKGVFCSSGVSTRRTGGYLLRIQNIG
ncbi:MAG TPA: hypothetical protein VEW46_03330 [Pyrinomonadaceae bacterium]|nr:hypothetical protein [Pyrinomonadaceae bacterium]